MSRKTSSLFAVFGVTLAGAMLFQFSASAQRSMPAVQTARATGAVTADRGVVRGARVKFRHTVHRMTYTVFTHTGRYQISNLPPGSYEVQVMEPAFESPVRQVELAPGSSTTIDIALKAVPPKPRDVQLVDFEALYPPGPGRDILFANCLGCHGKIFQQTRPMQRPKEGQGGWREQVSKMVKAPGLPGMGGAESVPDLTAQQQETLIDYLATNFGPNTPKRDLKMDDFVVDENAIADALYVEYELPSIEGAPPLKEGQRRRGLHDLTVMSDQMIWAGGIGSGSLLRMNPREMDFTKRFTEYFVDAPYNVGVRAVVEDKMGRYYWTEYNRHSQLGELDIRTGAMKRYQMLSPGTQHTLIADSKGNVWYTQFWGSHLGKLDAKTRKITEYAVPVVGADLYDVVADRNDVIWASGVGKNGNIFKFDPVTEKFTVFATPTKGSGPRRLEVASDGNIWVAESMGDRLAMINARTGDITEYPLPLRYTRPYEVWEAEGAIWTSDQMYSALVRFDRTTKKFTYYPLPTPGTGSPKAGVDKEGTSWFASRGANQRIVAFKPQGNARR